MSELVRLFISIALFRKGPQDVPYSVFLLAVLIAATFTIDLLTYLLPSSREEPLAVSIIIRYLLAVNVASFMMVYLIFFMHRHQNRFVQSITTMYGIDLMISILSIPVHLLLIVASNYEISGLAIIGILFIMFLIFWNLSVYMHIFRFGLGISFLHAGMLSLVLFVLSISISNLLIPAGTT